MHASGYHELAVTRIDVTVLPYLCYHEISVDVILTANEILLEETYETA